MATVLPQTNRPLLPGISITQEISPSPFLGITRNVVLVGFVRDVTKLINNSTIQTPINTPIYVGNITSVATAQSFCTVHGLQYKMLSDTTIDINNTDEIAAMLLNAALSYQYFSPLSISQQLAASQYIIGILDPAQNGSSNPLFQYVSTSGNMPQNGGYYLVPTTIVTPTNIPFSDNILTGQYFTVNNLSTVSITVSITGSVFEVTESNNLNSVTVISGAKISFMKSGTGKYVFLSGLSADNASGNLTPYGTFFTQMLAQNIPCDIIAQSYEYTAGDSDSAVNYLSELKAFSTAVYNSGNPNKGKAFSLLANIDFREGQSVGDRLNINNDQYSVTFVYPQVLSSSIYQIPSSWFCAFMAPILCGMQRPYNGFVLNPLQLMPSPDQNVQGTIYSDDTSNTLLQYGYSPLSFNATDNITFMSRMVVSYFTDAVTGIGRDYFIDYQDYCISFDYNLTVYRSLQAQQIINERFFINRDGSSDVLSQVYGVAFATAIEFYDLGMISIDPKKYAQKFMAYIDKDNFSRIILLAPLSASSIIYQIFGTTQIQNSQQVLSGIAIGTQG